MLHSTQGLSRTSPRPNTSRETAWSLTQGEIKDRARGMGTKGPGITIHLNLRRTGSAVLYPELAPPQEQETTTRIHSSLVFPERLNGRGKLEDRASLLLCLVPEHSPKDTELWALMTPAVSLRLPWCSKTEMILQGRAVARVHRGPG